MDVDTEEVPIQPEATARRLKLSLESRSEEDGERGFLTLISDNQAGQADFRRLRKRVALLWCRSDAIASIVSACRPSPKQMGQSGSASGQRMKAHILRTVSVMASSGEKRCCRQYRSHLTTRLRRLLRNCSLATGTREMHDVRPRESASHACGRACRRCRIVAPKWPCLGRW